MIDYEFVESTGKTPVLVLKMPNGMEGTEAAATLISLASVFNEALTVAHHKNAMYGSAWRRQGWMGNLARVMSKGERLKNLLWRDHEKSGAEEAATDTALDMVNIMGFFMINRSESNKWGTR
jgi:hypothetical protein